MTDRPIIFSSAMVQALLEGRKTMTRRLLRPQPDSSKLSPPYKPENRSGQRWVFMNRIDFPEYAFASQDFKAPYAPGDRLYVRENWARNWNQLSETVEDRSVVYMADDGPRAQDNGSDLPWKPSIHMPRWASRITLTVEAVKVERLQDISEEDARAEGVEKAPNVERHSYETPSKSYGAAFHKLWDSLNAKRAPWDSNPWVAVSSFKVHKRNIDQLAKENVHAILP